MNSSTEYNQYEKIYKDEIKKIESGLSKLLRDKKPESLYTPCSYILNGGGKRLRPFLVLISAKAVGGKFNQTYNAAMAMEILHNFTLVHDDIMDNSNMRRGRVTLHKKYDTNTAILAGDSLIALAYEYLLKDCKDNTKQIVSNFTKAVTEVCEGQSLDKEFELSRNVSIDDYKNMIYKKTAALMESCCAVGARIAGATNKQINAVARYGKYLGMAFQIQDDLLDLVADESEFGKTVGSDLIEGKKTYLLLRAMEKAKGVKRKSLQRVFENKGVKKEEIGFYKNLYIELGVTKDAEHEIIKYTKLALKNISTLPNKEGRELMNWLANILINRNK